jgi:hypothetical protein
MTPGQPEQQPAKGFAALGVLGSDISPKALGAAEEALHARKDEAEPSDTRAPAGASAPAPAPRPYQGPRTSAGSGWTLPSKGKMLIGAVVVVGGIWAYYGSDSGSYTPAPAIETPPPVGTGIVLSTDQIRYCLAEGIRLDAARGALNQYSQFDTSRFNGMISDYNSRCSQFRYRQGSLESVRAQVESERFQLQSEGAARFMK